MWFGPDVSMQTSGSRHWLVRIFMYPYQPTPDLFFDLKSITNPQSCKSFFDIPIHVWTELQVK